MERKRRTDARGYKRRARRENWMVQQQMTESRKRKDGGKESDGRMRVATKGEAKEERMVQQQRTEGRKRKDGWRESDGWMRVATKGEREGKTG